VPTANESLTQPFTRLAGGRFLADLFAGVLLVVTWFFLWTWMAFGVVAPLSHVPVGHGERVELHERA